MSRQPAANAPTADANVRDLTPVPEAPATGQQLHTSALTGATRRPAPAAAGSVKEG